MQDEIKTTSLIDPEAAITFFSEFAKNPNIGRPDIGIYLDQLTAFLHVGTDAGLFIPGWAFLVLPNDVNLFALQQLIDNPSDGFVLWNKGATCNAAGQASSSANTTCVAVWSDAIKSCNAPKLSAAWDRWQAARDGNFVPKLRLAFLRGDRIDATPLTDLTAGSCADPDVSKVVAHLRQYVWYSIIPLQIQTVLQRYATPGLVIAALLDYVVNQDQPMLDAHLRSALLFGVAAVVAQKMNADASDADATTAVTFADWMPCPTIAFSCARPRKGTCPPFRRSIMGETSSRTSTTTWSSTATSRQYHLIVRPAVMVYARAGVGVGITSDFLQGATAAGLAEGGGLGVEIRVAPRLFVAPELFYRRSSLSAWQTAAGLPQDVTESVQAIGVQLNLVYY